MASKPTSTEELSWRLPLTVAVVSLLVIAFMSLSSETQKAGVVFETAPALL